MCAPCAAASRKNGEGSFPYFKSKAQPSGAIWGRAALPGVASTASANAPLGASATSKFKPGNARRKRAASARARSGVRLTITTSAGARCASAYTTAAAAPPAPSTQTRAARTSMACRSSVASTPATSVLCPSSEPSLRRATTFTAPTAWAERASRSTSCAARSLCGIVTLIPAYAASRRIAPKSGARSPAGRSSRS